MGQKATIVSKTNSVNSIRGISEFSLNNSYLFESLSNFFFKKGLFLLSFSSHTFGNNLFLVINLLDLSESIKKKKNIKKYNLKFKNNYMITNKSIQSFFDSSLYNGYKLISNNVKVLRGLSISPSYSMVLKVRRTPYHRSFMLSSAISRWLFTKKKKKAFKNLIKKKYIVYLLKKKKNKHLFNSGGYYHTKDLKKKKIYYKIREIFKNLNSFNQKISYKLFFLKNSTKYFLSISRLFCIFLATPLKSFWFFFLFSRIFLKQRKRAQKRFLYAFKRLCSFLFNKKVYPFMNSQIKGIKCIVSGRLQGKMRASKFSFYEGTMPLQTLSSKFKYFYICAKSRRFGTYGFKIWLLI